MVSQTKTGSILLLLCAWGYAGSVQKRHPCTDILEYRELEAMLTHDKCLNVDSLFAQLVSIEVNGKHASCRRALEQKFKAKYPQGSKMPSTCKCTGANVLHHYDNLPNFQDLNRRCGRDDRHYLSLYDMFFPNPFVKVDVPACRTHHSVWYDLASISSSSCYMDLVRHITNVFKIHKDPCRCFDATNAVNSSTTVKPTDMTPHNTDMTTDLSTDITTTNQLATVPVVTTLNPNCENDTDIKALKLLMQVDSCFSIHSVWYRLNRIQTTNPGCMGIVDIIAHHYGEQNTTTCACTGHVIKPNPFSGEHHNRSFSHCFHDLHFEALEQSLFKGHNGCVDHKLIWSPLHLISNQGECRKHFFEIAASRYSSPMDDPCSCNQTKPILAPVLDISTTTTSKTKTTPTPTKSTTTTSTAAATKTTTITTTVTTTAATKTTAATTTTTATTTKPNTTTSSTNTVPTTTATPYVCKHYTCQKFRIVQAIANHEVVQHNASACANQDPDDGFVLTECNVTKNTTEWHRGQSVMSNCSDIPWYTPVAMFRQNATTYTPAGAQSGVFAGCLRNGTGIRIILEHCDNNGPEIVHVPGNQTSPTGLTPMQDPNNYYVIC